MGSAMPQDALSINDIELILIVHSSKLKIKSILIKLYFSIIQYYLNLTLTALITDKIINRQLTQCR